MAGDQGVGNKTQGHLMLDTGKKRGGLYHVLFNPITEYPCMQRHCEESRMA